MRRPCDVRHRGAFWKGSRFMTYHGKTHCGRLADTGACCGLCQSRWLCQSAHFWCGHRRHDRGGRRGRSLGGDTRGTVIGGVVRGGAWRGYRGRAWPRRNASCVNRWRGPVQPSTIQGAICVWSCQKIGDIPEQDHPFVDAGFRPALRTVARQPEAPSRLPAFGSVGHTDNVGSATLNNQLSPGSRDGRGPCAD